MFFTADSLMLTHMCVTADILMLAQYVLYSSPLILAHMCVTSDSIMLTQYVRYSRQFNAHTICTVQQTV